MFNDKGDVAMQRKQFNFQQKLLNNVSSCEDSGYSSDGSTHSFNNNNKFATPETVWKSQLR